MPKVGRSLSFSPTSIPFARAVLKLKYRNRPLAHYQTPVPHGRPEPDPVVDTPPPNPTACVALQNEDFVEDAVIITSLSAVPFCCHEDLLTMSRPGLIGVAEALNDKLPAALRISTNRTRTDAAIRNEIEFIQGTVPDATDEPHSRLAACAKKSFEGTRNTENSPS
ncbi:Glutamine amidotransferase type-2 domain-containing protein [Mycena kentingensis (nom. inval.)]|nr:Glutamine amidotransferase type-2 domain-containing protein [Mycena kentingensis (nom. inval.)]